MSAVTVSSSNTVPARAWADTRDRLWTLLRVTTQVDRFHTLHEQTARQDPGIARWMADHPMKVLAHAADWHGLVRTTGVGLHEKAMAAPGSPSPDSVPTDGRGAPHAARMWTLGYTELDRRGAEVLLAHQPCVPCQ
ncbi:DUF3322 domain-containing protein [Streptomyces coeruleorubidus]|uniref:DUF3322 domain-containing protein n=1 Tax=Streptomyces coeruleorubidus TaxID=116188 RepID=UPI0036F85673